MHRQTLAGIGTLLIAVLPISAQTRRALVVGIDSYSLHRPAIAGGSALSVKSAAVTSGSQATFTPGEDRPFVGDLAGARADARAIAQLLQAKYGFQAQNIKLLLDGEATRAGIIAAIEALTRASQRGDVVTFYYAGHGAQRLNSKSWKPTHLDQTIVPVDANSGVFDIRDKELAVLFNGLLDKGVTLTLIFDSCHSGSVTRGATGRIRLAPYDKRDSRDDSRPTPPEERGALVFSAAQDDQTAAETRDPDGVDHGAFTSALIRVLRSMPANEPAHQIYQRVKAMVQSEGDAQEPVIKGTEANKRRPLFGDASGELGGRTTVAVLHIEADTVVLQGGLALGFGSGTELIPIASKNTVAAEPVRLRVVAITGMSSSRAVAVSGNAMKLAPGTLFAVDKWAPPQRPILQVFIPPALTADDLSKVTRSVAELRASPALEWVEDPSAVNDEGRPLFLVFATRNGWQVRSPLGTVASVATPTGDEIAAAVTSLASAYAQRVASDALASGNAVPPAAAKTRVFVIIPPTSQIRDALKVGPGSLNSAIALVESPEGADYVLAGHLTPDGVKYAWLRPDATLAAQKLSSLPARTAWFLSTQADSLQDRVLRLARINGWLTLDSPPQDEFFPYELALRNAQSGEMKSSGETRGGEKYDLVLRRDTAQHPKLVSRRWVYVFAIDSYGKGVPLYPQSGTVENRVPFDSLDVKSLLPAEIRLPRRTPVSIGAPYGVDTWVLVTSDEAIDVETFRFDGVRTERGGREGGGLRALLERVGEATRAGLDDPLPTSWSIQRITLLSRDL